MTIFASFLRGAYKLSGAKKAFALPEDALRDMMVVKYPLKERQDFLHDCSPHFIALIISSFTSSVGFPAERSLLRKARSAPRISRTSLEDSSTIRFSALGGTFAAPPLLSAPIVSADAHGKCANENLPKSEYGSLLKGCRRSTNWKL